MPTRAADPDRPIARRLAGVVTGVGGGALGAWVLVSAVNAMSHSHPFGSASAAPVSLAEIGIAAWLFACTGVLGYVATAGALRGTKPDRWLVRHVVCGGFNAWACMLLPLGSAIISVTSGRSDAPAEALLAFAIMIAVAWVVGALFGFAFFVLYLPVLTAGARAEREPSHDRLTRMLPRAGIWLALIALLIGQVGRPRPVLAVVCALAAAALVGWALRRDVGRLRILRALRRGEPAVTIDRELGARVALTVHDAAPDGLTPFVLGPPPARTLSATRLVGDGAFREADLVRPRAAISADLADEHRVVVRRIAHLAVVLLAACANAAAAL